ncbi:MAG: hypothetical protein Q9226_003946 [Calogaya cf. arnoldii]
MEASSVRPLPPEIQCRIFDYENIEKVSLRAIGFVFKAFSSHNEKAIFELEEDIYDGFKPTIAGSMSSLMYWYLQPEHWPEECYAYPRYYISIAKEANDTGLPGLDWNLEKIEISIDWKEMFNKLCGEEDAYQRMVNAAIDSQGKKLREMLDDGEIDKMEGIEKAFKVLGDAWDNSRKRTRRQRLQRQLHGLSADEREELIDRNEKFGFNDFLKEIRWGLSWPSDSEGGSKVDEEAEDELDDDFEDGGMDLERYLDSGAEDDESDKDALDSPGGSAE